MNDHDQYAFTDLIDEMEETERMELDQHRVNVQRWFDTLPEAHQCELSAMMWEKEWLTCQALSAAACDFYQSQPLQRQVAAILAGMKAAVEKLNGVGKKE